MGQGLPASAPETSASLVQPRVSVLVSPAYGSVRDRRPSQLSSRSGPYTDRQPGPRGRQWPHSENQRTGRNGRTPTWRACREQPLASSNLASSAPSDQAERRPARTAAGSGCPPVSVPVSIERPTEHSDASEHPPAWSPGRPRTHCARGSADDAAGRPRRGLVVSRVADSRRSRAFCTPWSHLVQIPDLLPQPEKVPQSNG
jgi:hypothetical protein